MKLGMFVVLAICACTQARADFVDERTQPNTAPAVSAAPLEVASKASAVATPRFDVLASDRNLREVLARWGKEVGWKQKWTIDKDIPVEATADADLLGSDFKNAVRKLLSSTDLTDRPLQPCFHTNKVLRVIPKAELCDRTVE
jgi:hypothetical protein